MTYRDDREALQARIQKLEGDVGAARIRVAELTREAGPGPHDSRLLGAPTGVTLERALPFEIDDAGYEAVAAIVRARLGVEVTRVGTTLTTPGDELTLSREDGRTVVRLRRKWGRPGFRSMMTGVAGLLLLASQLISSDLTGLLLALSMCGLSAWSIRATAQQTAQKNLDTYRGALDAIMEAAQQHRRDDRVRVADEVVAEVDAEVGPVERVRTHG